jgi:hypothetical protein
MKTRLGGGPCDKDAPLQCRAPLCFGVGLAPISAAERLAPTDRCLDIFNLVQDQFAYD